MCHDVGPFYLNCDGFDLDDRELLAVALLALVALPLVFLEHDDLSAAFVFEDGGGDGSACERRSADPERVAFAGGQHILDRDRVALFRIREAVNGQDVAFGDNILLALGFDRGFHKINRGLSGFWRRQARRYLLENRALASACGGGATLRSKWRRIRAILVH